jgi:mono/diheme cytochrome c family protein
MTQAISGWTVIGLFLLAAVTHAGGWAVVTVTLPDTVVVGQPVTVRYSVRQHGQRLLNGLQGRVEAWSGGTVISAPATATDKDGHYAATLTLPRAGTWTLDVVSGFPNGSGRAALRAVRPGDDTESALSPVAKGSGLFVSKGCATCHLEGMSSAPAIKGSGYEPQYLTQFLKRPPVRGANEWGMPDLELDEEEIASLVAYLNAARTRGSSSAQADSQVSRP